MLQREEWNVPGPLNSMPSNSLSMLPHSSAHPLEDASMDEQREDMHVRNTASDGQNEAACILEICAGSAVEGVAERDSGLTREQVSIREDGEAGGDRKSVA